MKYLLILLLTINTALGCDWSKIKKVDGLYQYPVACHIEVGKLQKVKQANEKLLKAIELKDLALDVADERITRWRAESYNQHDRLLKQKQIDSWNDWLYFSGGIAVTILSVWAAGQATK